MTDSITSTFNYAGGIIDAEISATNANITFEKDGETVVIEDSCGDVFRFDHHNWSLLKGAAYDTFAEKKAREFAIESFGAWVVCASQELANA